MYDVIVVGGSYAGTAAALQLGRARRRTLVIDAGQRRNRFAAHAHGLLTQDGQPPGEIAARAKQEVLVYPSISWLEASVAEARKTDAGFAVRAGTEELHSQMLILASGIVDQLPALPGFAERWGKSVFHCPYCHGYELDRGKLGVLAPGSHAALYAILVSEWSGPGMTMFLNGEPEPAPEMRGHLDARGIQLERTAVSALEGDAPRVAVRLADGRTIQLDGLFAPPRSVLASAFAEPLGLELEQGPNGPYYKTDAMKQTSVPGVFACGDNAIMAGALSMAVGDGARAGVSAHQALVFRSLTPGA